MRLQTSLLLLVALAPPVVAETPLQRGKYLMASVVACGNCHTPMGPQGPLPGRELAGGTEFREAFGVARAPNITPDPKTGIGSWTDRQIVAAIREGRRPDGSVIGPPMPIGLYRGMSDADVQAIVAYLRQVKPVRNPIEKSAYAMPLQANFGPPVVTVAPPARSDKIAYGAYLAGPLGHCLECHSTPNAEGVPDVAGKTGGGGMTFNGPWGVSRAPNITPTQLGTWTDEQIKTAITMGVRPDGSRLNPPMGFAYYRAMRAEDIDAIVAYLRTLRPL